MIFKPKKPKLVEPYVPASLPVPFEQPVQKPILENNLYNFYDLGFNPKEDSVLKLLVTDTNSFFPDFKSDLNENNGYSLTLTSVSVKTSPIMEDWSFIENLQFQVYHFGIDLSRQDSVDSKEELLKNLAKENFVVTELMLPVGTPGEHEIAETFSYQETSDSEPKIITVLNNQTDVLEVQILADTKFGARTIIVVIQEHQLEERKLWNV